MSALSIEAMAQAQSQVGQKENPIGSNWGHPVQDYLLRVGINFPASWCLAFVYWCFDEAAKKLGIPNPVLKTGGVMNLFNHEKVNIVFEPQPGDIMILDLGHGLGHTGIVVSADPTVIHTIEGNTNDTGSREGFEVIPKLRNRSTVKGYIRF